VDDDFLKLHPSISVGSIVSIRSADSKNIPGYIGIVVETNVWEPGGRRIYIPGIGEVETGLDKCYNATEAERKEYFKNVLKYE